MRRRWWKDGQHIQLNKTTTEYCLHGWHDVDGLLFSVLYSHILSLVFPPTTSFSHHHSLIIDCIFISNYFTCIPWQQRLEISLDVRDLNKYNRQERCVRCMVISQKHANILQYKESKCFRWNTFLIKLKQVVMLEVLYSLMFSSHSILLPFLSIFPEESSRCLFRDQWGCLPLLFI